MAKIDLTPLSLSELNALKTRIETAISRQEKKSKSAALAKLQKTAKSMGFSLGELVETKSPPTKKRAPAKKPTPRPAMYRDQTNAKNTWSGRGPRPAWLKEQLAGGKTLEEFKIKD